MTIPEFDDWLFIEDKQVNSRSWWLCPDCGWYMCNKSTMCRCGYIRPLIVNLLSELPANADFGYKMTEEELASWFSDHPNAQGVRNACTN